MQTGVSTSETTQESGEWGSQDTNESQDARSICQDKSCTNRRYHGDNQETVLTACPGCDITPWLGWNTWSSEYGAVLSHTSDCQLTPPGVAMWVVVTAFEVGQFLRESTRLHAVFRRVLSFLKGADTSGYFLQLPFVLAPLFFESAVSNDFGVGTPFGEGTSGFGQCVESPFWSV